MSLYDTPVTSTVEAPVVTPTTPTVGQATSVMSPTEAQRRLDTYGIDPSQTLSASNIIQTLTRPTAAPDDLLGIRSQINYDLGLDTASKKLNDLKSQYYKAPSVIEGQRLNMGVLRGETALAQNRLAAEIQAQQDTVNSLTAERDYRMGIAEQNVNFVKQLKLQYSGAKIGYGDSMDTIEKKLVKYQDQVKSDAKKDAYKESLMKLGLKTSGSLKDMEKRLSKAGKDAKKAADKLAELQYKKAEIDIANTRSIIAERNTPAPSWTPAAAYGDNTQNGMSVAPATNTSTPTASSNNPLSYFYNNPYQQKQ